MATRLYSVYNSAQLGAAAVTKKASAVNTTVTQLQVNIATQGLEIIEWGVSFDSSAAAQPGPWELIGYTGGNITNLTAYVAADVNKVSGSQGGAASLITLGTSASGFNNIGTTTEVTPTTIANFDTQLLPPTSPYIKQLPLERGYTIGGSAQNYFRIRGNMQTAVNVLCYAVWAE